MNLSSEGGQQVRTKEELREIVIRAVQSHISVVQNHRTFRVFKNATQHMTVKEWSRVLQTLSEEYRSIANHLLLNSSDHPLDNDLPQQRSGYTSRHTISTSTLTDQTRIPRPSSLPRPTTSVLLPPAVSNPSSAQPAGVEIQRCHPAALQTSLNVALAHNFSRSTALSDNSVSSRSPSLIESSSIDSSTHIQSLSNSSQPSSTRLQAKSPSTKVTPPTVPLKRRASNSEARKIAKSAKKRVNHFEKPTSDDDKTQECGKRTEQNLPPLHPNVQCDSIGDEILAVVRSNNSSNGGITKKFSDAQRKDNRHILTSLSTSATQVNNQQHFRLGVALHSSDTNNRGDDSDEDDPSITYDTRMLQTPQPIEPSTARSSSVNHTKRYKRGMLPNPSGVNGFDPEKRKSQVRSKAPNGLYESHINKPMPEKEVVQHYANKYPTHQSLWDETIPNKRDILRDLKANTTLNRRVLSGSKLEDWLTAVLDYWKANLHLFGQDDATAYNGYRKMKKQFETGVAMQNATKSPREMSKQAGEQRPGNEIRIDLEEGDGSD